MFFCREVGINPDPGSVSSHTSWQKKCSLKRQLEKDLEIGLGHMLTGWRLGTFAPAGNPHGPLPSFCGNGNWSRKTFFPQKCLFRGMYCPEAASDFLLKTTSCCGSGKTNEGLDDVSYLEEEAEADPLVVLHVLLVPLVPRLVHPRVGHVHPHPLPVGGGERVGGVDPAVGVQHLLRDVLRVDAHDRRTDVLPRRHDEGECEQDHNGRPVMESKYTTVRVETANFH